MDSDMVMEVPDTPERASCTRGIDDKTSSSNHYLEPVTRTYSRQMKNSTLHGFNGNGITPADNDFLFSQARIARVISEIPHNETNLKTIDLSEDTPIRCRSSRNKEEEKHLSGQRERNQITGYRKPGLSSSASMEVLRKAKHIASNSKDFVSSSNTDEAQNPKFQKTIVQKLNSQATNEQRSSSNHDIDAGAGAGVGTVSRPITRSTDLRPEELVLRVKNMGHKRLVRNGCISPSNVARYKNDAKDKGIDARNAVSIEKHDNNSCQPVHRMRSEGRTADKGKGKEVMNDEFLGTSQLFVARPPYRRSCLMPQMDVTIISDMDYDTDRIQIDGFEGKHRHLGSSSLLPSHAAHISEGKNMSHHLSNSRGENTKYALSIDIKPEENASQSGRNITRVQGCFKLNSEAPPLTGKRKINFMPSNAGECSSSTIDSPRISYDRTFTKPSYQRSTRSRKLVRVDTELAPIVEIDEIESNTQEGTRERLDESIARSMQLESDEILARQLQEQFYLESPTVGAIEREASLPPLLGRPIFPNSSTRQTSRSRTENRAGRLRRNISRPTMSLEERFHFLEALEAAFEYDNGLDTPVHFFDAQRDFNENDYEMLLALDDNNRHLGASERQINRLPQSLFQSTDSEEACVVCLETPVVGDAIRHLPCLHKFHKDCIDTWLRRKRSCPICKSGIN
ncbi:uncharacterized protein LOC110031875 [Phalaenopsis equestris]|uniref:uncharacterized protein LOC110031875 n=1 Tax=Phalaenopsis equestris TaxID=78828 RepID=UPI0009E47768|nr:uncharacterized protein LOC110031875 [Phalaenopsis equestris]